MIPPLSNSRARSRAKRRLRKLRAKLLSVAREERAALVTEIRDLYRFVSGPASRVDRLLAGGLHRPVPQ